MAENSTTASPQITADELLAFQATHFSTSQITNYAKQFLGPVDETPGEEYYEEEDYGFGYYDDGVKRTLTDEQIAMFRHSEIQALLRKQRVVMEAIEIDGADGISASSVAADYDMEQGDAAPSIGQSEAPGQARKGKKKKKKQRGEKGWYKENVKPDLRKRTWDVVDEGVGSLEYGDEGGGEPAAKRVMQRRQISYDD